MHHLMKKSRHLYFGQIETAKGGRPENHDFLFYRVIALGREAFGANLAITCSLMKEISSFLTICKLTNRDDNMHGISSRN